MELVSSIVVYAEHKISFTKEFCFLPAQKNGHITRDFPQMMCPTFLLIYS